MTKLTVLILTFMAAFPSTLHGITTIHHDKPEGSRMSKMVTTMREPVPSTVFPERHKRLLPYVNYYLSRNNRKQARQKFTPFLESNALPGPFIPIVKTTPKNGNLEYTQELPVTEKSPNYAEIYDTLSRLKQAQQAMHNLNQIYQKHPVSFVPVHYYEEESYRNVPTGKTIIETYTPTNIDIDVEDRTKYEPGVEFKAQVVEKPVESYKESTKPYFGEKIIINKPLVVYERKPTDYTQNEKPETYTLEITPKPQINTIIDEKPATYTVEITPKPHVNTIIDEKYVAQKYIPIETTQTVYSKQSPIQYVSEKPPYVQEYFSSPSPNVPTENTNILAKLLKQLQHANMLPQTLTPQNIDNSIRTLVKILNSLKNNQGLTAKPIVVLEEDSTEGVGESDEVVEKPFPEKPIFTPGSFTQTFPANTIDGGTPGRPGIDYPALSSIPQTDFNCKKQRYKGFFGDPHTNCQVWHYCDLNGGQASFLCPNGTIFSQVALTCDWWYNVKCSSTAQLYVLNERLYKYILPLAPKFPEDYSGPLVDRYLALKFQEMEEKMKKGKKKESKSEEEKDDSDQLQDIRNEQAKSSEER